jgi:hypothetical protein
LVAASKESEAWIKFRLISQHSLYIIFFEANQAKKVRKEAEEDNEERRTRQRRRIDL